MTDVSLHTGVVDLVTGVLRTGGDERRLRPMELRLLAHLAGHPMVTQSPGELLRHVWGYADGVETRTLYATINRLRQAVERDPNQPDHVETVPRVGYRFRPLGRLGPTSDLPTAPGRLVGRDDDCARLDAELGSARSVLMRGAAGVGKSRVANAVGRGRVARGEHVVWCALGNVHSPEELQRVVAAGLGLSAGPRGVGGLAAALAALGDALVVLDDADQVHDALGPLLAEWLAVPGPTFLITSRRGAPLPATRQVVLAPLSVPTELGEIGSDSGELLATRLAEREATAPLDRTASWVGPLLRTLGGLPLAIELAVPWLTAMGGPGLLEHVRGSLLGLSDGSGVGARHHSLGAALCWSWPLLQPWERAVLLDCAVFESPFDVAAAEAVCDLGPWPLAPPLALVLGALVEHSWLRSEVRPFGKYLAFYAGQQEFLRGMADPAIRAASVRRHLAFHARLASEVDVEALFLRGGDGWLRLRARRDDLRAALRRVTDGTMADGAAAGHGSGELALAIALGRLLVIEGPLEECLDVTQRDSGGASAAERLALVKARAVALRQLGRVPEARSVLEQALCVGGADAHPREYGRLLRALGVVELYHGSLDRARSLLFEAVAVLARAGEALDEAIARAEVGTLEFLHGDPEHAIAILDAALGPLRSGSGAVYAVYLTNLGVAELSCGRVASAEAHLVEALDLHRLFGSARFEALALGNLALVQERKGDAVTAHCLLDAAFDRTRRTGDKGEEGTLWSNRGLVLLSQGRNDLASAALERAAALAGPTPRLQAEVLIRRARVSIAWGEREQAVRLLDAAERLASSLGLAVEARDLVRVRAILDGG